MSNRKLNENIYIWLCILFDYIYVRFYIINIINMSTLIQKKSNIKKEIKTYKELADIYIQVRKSISTEDVYQNIKKNKTIYQKFTISKWKQQK